MTVGRKPARRRAVAVALLGAGWLAGSAAAGDLPPLPQPRPDLAEEPADRGILVAALIPEAVRIEAITEPSGGGLAVLSPADADRYAAIFAAQAHADWPTADRLIAALDDDLLLGHVLAQRYLHPTGWRTTWQELSAWLARYTDLPDAMRIHALALKRMPEGASPPPAPVVASLDGYTGEAELVPVRDSGVEPDWSHLDATQRTALRDMMRGMRRAIRDGDNDGATRRLAAPEFVRLADPLTADRTAAEVAQGWFVAGDDRRARELAAPAMARSGSAAPLACWIAGLAAYRQGDLDAARRAFEILAAGPADRDLVIAGAYWAARLNLLTARPDRVRPYLQIAQSYPYSFYGLLARRALGGRIAFDEDLPPLDAGERATLATLAPVRRAVALVQAGQQHRADREFDAVSVGDQPALALALLRLAGELGLPATQYRLGGELLNGYATRYDAALYPLPPWQPADGFEVDPALLYAIMRRESGFHAFSRSDAGARGPMQIMPGTAAYISGDDGFLGAKRNLLNDPRIALDLAQDYIRHLLESEDIGGNLFFALAAYNGGPGNLRRWLDASGAPYDPLLFIETIPSRETRFFVERVMASYWMYRVRLGDHTPTLDMVASGAWPLYADEEQTNLARN